jgi:pimeloyl-ACP methyl ester carboxylesterase
MENLFDRVIVGAGPPVVLIHGTGVDAATNWGPLIEVIRDRYTIIAPNLPGAGATPEPDEPLSVEGLAANVIATARSAGAQRFHLIGHSLGAVIATAVAAHAPDSVASLCLHAGWLRTRAREAFMFDLWARLLRSDRSLLARHLILTAMGPDMLRSLDEAKFAEFEAGFSTQIGERILAQIELDARVDLRSCIGRVSAPTLVLASADDQLLPTYHQRELADAIAGARYQEVPGGHGLPLEDPARFAAIVAEFIDTQQAAGSAPRL